MRTKIVPISQLYGWIRTLPPSFEVGTLLVGDRISCCDEAAVVEVSGEIAAVATIAPRGEMMSGEPTIVALYTVPAYRKMGYGAIAFKAALDRCRQRGFSKVRVDVMSNHVLRIIANLPAEDQAYLEVHNLGPLMDGLSGLIG